MKPHASPVTLTPDYLDRARRPSGGGLAWPVCGLASGNVLPPRPNGAVDSPVEHPAWDADLDPEGCGFWGVALAHSVPEHESWGGRSGYLADPDGRPREVAWNPHFPLGPGGYPGLPA